MKKETLAEKLARKIFQSRAFQRGWNVHVQAFGPILEPAFAEDYPARIRLSAALNLLSRQKLAEALQKLQALSIFLQRVQKRCLAVPVFENTDAESRWRIIFRVYIIGVAIHDHMVQQRVQATVLAVEVTVEGLTGNTSLITDLTDCDIRIRKICHDIQQTLLQLPLPAGAVFCIAVFIHKCPHLSNYFP